MARVAAWRDTCPTNVRALQQLASLRPILLLRQNGPVAFTVQEAETTPVQVKLGDPHHCTCKTQQRFKDLCIHICWVLLKKLQLKPYNPLSYQLGLVERELHDLLEPRHPERSVVRKPIPARTCSEDMATVPKRRILPADICPICLLPFRDSKLPLVHCRYSCGNAVHGRCMVQVARHQLDSSDVTTDRLLSCPLCRGPFCRGRELWEAVRQRSGVRTRTLSPVVRHDVSCVICQVRPVIGNLYRCLKCSQVLLCASCLTSPDFTVFHDNHGYAIKKDKWRVARPANWVPPSKAMALVSSLSITTSSRTKP